MRRLVIHGLSGPINGKVAMLVGDHVRKAAELICAGDIYSLAVTTNSDSGAYKGRTYQVVVGQDAARGERTFGSNKLQATDDFVCLWCGVGTHLDGFGHIAVDGKHLGDRPIERNLTGRGVAELGVETIPPIVTRGVLLDICRLKEVGALPDGYEITREDIDAACELQGVDIRPGDVVLFHTGTIKDLENKVVYAPHGGLQPEPGIGEPAAQYLVEDKGVVVIGADNWALEVIPSSDRSKTLPVHGYLLAKQGVHIIEHVWTQDLARDRVYAFFFAAAGPKLTGAVQMPVHPIAIR